MEGGQAAKVLENLSFFRNLVLVNKGIYFVPQQGNGLVRLLDPISGLRN